jgi:hypothetical protein
MPRTFKEICAVVTDTNKKEIGRCYKAIIKELETNVGVTHVSDFMRRWGSLLGLANKDMRAGTAIAEAACPRDGMWVPSWFSLSGWGEWVCLPGHKVPRWLQLHIDNTCNARIVELKLLL